GALRRELHRRSMVRAPTNAAHGSCRPAGQGPSHAQPEAIMMKSSIVCAALGAVVACDGPSGRQPAARSAAAVSADVNTQATGGGTVNITALPSNILA